MFQLIKQFNKEAWEEFNRFLFDKKKATTEHFSDISRQHAEFKEFFNEKSSEEVINSVLQYVQEYLVQRKDQII